MAACAPRLAETLTDSFSFTVRSKDISVTETIDVIPLLAYSTARAIVTQMWNVSYSFCSLSRYMVGF
jgi:hypothetical protein